MLSATRRLYSSSASSIASSFLTTTQSHPPLTLTQTLDSSPLQRLSLTLSRPNLYPSLPITTNPPPAQTALPPGYHLVYFTPSQLESELGADGTDTTFNPPTPFTRRMWAGGELRWTGKENLLRVGQEVVERTRLISAEGKTTRKGQMIVVGVEKTFENSNGVALVDRRNWIFRPQITIPSSPLPPPLKPLSSPISPHPHTRTLAQTPTTLFRFSALTFNAHKIHYSREWCRVVEGHRDLVVHGPLNLICILDFWRDVFGYGRGEGKKALEKELEKEKNRDKEKIKEEKHIVPKSITYRATSPLYVGEPYRIHMGEEREKVVEVEIVDGYGAVAMKGRIEAF